VFFGPPNQTYWDDFTCKVWATANQDVSSETVHNSLFGLTLGDPHTQYPFLAGRSGGQTLNLGLDASDNGVIDSTAHATKGNLVLQPSGGKVGIGIATPDGPLHVHHSTAGVATAVATADDLVVEHSTYGGISILTGDAGSGLLAFGSPTDSVGGYLAYAYGDGSSPEVILATGIANGVVKLNSGNNTRAVTIDASQQVGIGTVSPDAKLHVSSGDATTALLIDNNTYLSSKDSGGTARALMYMSASAKIRIGGGAPTAFSVSVSGAPEGLYMETGGNVGIATPTPASKLDVNGILTLRPTGSVSTIQTNSADARLTFIADRSTATNAAFAFEDSSSNRLVTILDNGRVGIGTATPGYELHTYRTTGNAVNMIETTSTSSATLRLKNSEGEFGVYTDDDAVHIYDFTDAAIRLTVDGDGNVGIGTSAPAHLFHIQHPTSTAIMKFGSATGQAGNIISRGLDASGNYRDFSITVNEFGINTANTDEASGSTLRFRIEHTTGHVGINISNPTELLHVSGGNIYLEDDIIYWDNEDPVQAKGVYIGSGARGGGASSDGLTVGLITSQTSGKAIFRVNSTGGAERLRVEHDGYVATENTKIAMNYNGDGASFSNADGWLYFASDAYLQWDESEDAFYFPKDLGIGTTTPTGRLTLFRGTGDHYNYVQNTASGQGTGNGLMWGIQGTPAAFLYQYESNPFYIGQAATVAIYLSGSQMGVWTASPSRVLDVNQGAGNMIADGYDNHSTPEFKEKIKDVNTSGVLSRIKAHKPKTWKRTPFVGTEELYQEAREEFDLPIAHGRESRDWMANLEPGSPEFVWVAQRRSELRSERASNPKYTSDQFGLVADTDLAGSLPEIAVYEVDGDDTSEVAGYNMNAYVAMLHAAIIELSEQVEALSN
jgi:hypothetical protein